MKERINKYTIALLSVIMVCLLAVPASADYNFEGYQIKNMTNGTVQGDVYVSNGTHAGLANTPYITNYSVPGGTVKWARLVVGVWGGRATYTGWLNTTLSNSTHTHNLGNVSIDNTQSGVYGLWSNGTNVYGTGCGCWMVSYNCTDNVTQGTLNSVSANTGRTGGTTFDGRIYGIILTVVYENESLSKVEYWINEGNVNLHYPVDYEGTYYPALNNTVSWFNGTAYNSTEANLTVGYYTGTVDEHDYLFLNAPNVSDSPGNLSDANVQWNNSSAYRMYQLDNNDVADSHSDKDGVCDDNSIYTHGFDLNCFSETNDSEYSVTDIINTTANNYATFWRGRDDNGNGVIEGSFGQGNSEGEAYMHPIMAVLRLQLEHIYDFSTGAGTDKWAYRDEVSINPPNTCDVPNNEFTATQYVNISADDGTYQTDFSDNNYAAHGFNFSIDEDAGNITEINVTWNGKGWHDNGGAANGAYLYICNGTGYEELANNSGVGTDATLTGEVTSSISSYINAGNVTVLVVQNTAGTGFSASRIETDYVRVVVTP